MGVELIFAFVLLGVVVGIMAGLLGIGFGGIIVPVLASILWFMALLKRVWCILPWALQWLVSS